MFCRITIPRMSNLYKLYVYSSKNANDINTIAKVRTIQPTYIIDESIAKSKNVNGVDSYVIDDTPYAVHQNGITYVGPTQNFIPAIEHDASFGVVKINNYTYVNKLTLSPLNTNYVGTVIYYSVIGVNDQMNTITHLSKVSQVLIDCNYKQNSVRHIYSSDDMDSNNWTKIGTASWQEDIVIGDISNSQSIARYGIPFIDVVPQIDDNTAKFDTRPILGSNFGVLEIENPWQSNNKKFNYRKCKSFKVQSVIGNNYGPFSEPTYQSVLPVSIEKMLILRETDSKNSNHIDISKQYTQGIESFEIIRRDGIYYHSSEHKVLGMNKYNIPLGETVAVFNESSTQDTIKWQLPAEPGHVYKYTVYLIDVYGKHSAPISFIATT